MKKKLLILFPEGNLPYSPTTLNLIQFLSADFDVTVVASEFKTGIKLNIDNFNLLLLKPNNANPDSSIKKVLLKIIEKSGLRLRDKVFERQHQTIFKQIKKAILFVKPDHVIAVDLFALACCKKINIPCVFLSLEIPSVSIYYNALNYEKIEAVIIQRSDRFDYLFKDGMRKPLVFILPNAPVYAAPEKRTKASKKLIYNGYIWSAFGAQFCFNLLSKYPEFELNLKGVMHPENMVGIYYPHLTSNSNVSMDSNYLSDNDLKSYLSDFSIGFCFYHFEHPFICKNSFNYQTGPSGKLFAYLSAGLPVVCSDIPAFSFVKDADAGILINDYSPDTLKAAIETILSNYQSYSDHALELASDHSFSKHIQPVLKYLKNN